MKTLTLKQADVLRDIVQHVSYHPDNKLFTEYQVYPSRNAQGRGKRNLFLGLKKKGCIKEVEVLKGSYMYQLSSFIIKEKS